MKINYLFIIALLLIANKLEAQVTENTQDATEANYIYNQPRNCSPYTALLISNIKRGKSKDYLKEHFNTIKIDDITYVSAFIKTSSNFDESKISDFGVKLNRQAGNLRNSLIPIDELENVLTLNGIKYIDIGKEAEADLDEALEQTNVDLVHSGNNLNQSYTGDGVITGIIDIGFDYTHPTFYNASYTQYRVSRVWEQEENGTPPSGFNIGNEIIGETNILNNANDGLNAGSHGTHVAGISSGSGSVLSNSYKGVAYESEIVFVSTTLQNTDTAKGIAYIFDYADSVNKPAVVNMSLGNHIGPHDGSSSFDLFCDNLVNNGKILVGSAGNEGSKNLHLDYDFNINESIYSFMEFPNNNNSSSGGSYVDIWGEAGNDFEIRISVYNIDDDEYEDSTNYISTSTDATYNIDLQDSDPLFSDIVPLNISVEHSNPNNGKPHILFTFDNTDQDESQDIYDYVLVEVKGTNTGFDAWCRSCEFTDFNSQYPIINGNSNSTMGETGGTGNSIISVGAYTSKKSWTDFQGNPWSYSNAQVGDIASFSSLGPTVDGRTKPDISAPGQVIVSSVSSFDNNYDSSSQSVVAEISSGSESWRFAQLQGTSMASPMVAGIVALWLEADPTLNPDEIKQLLQNNSITDNYTGSVPNNTWGYGKIDAHQALQALEATMGIDSPENKMDVYLYPNPSNGIFTLNLGNHQFNDLKVFNMSGKLVYKENINGTKENKQVNLSNLTNGTYLIKVSNNKMTENLKLLIN